MSERSPRIASALLRILMGREHARAILDDLDEIFDEHRLRRGRAWAWRWYWRQVVASVPASVRVRMGRAGAGSEGRVGNVMEILQAALRQVRRTPQMSMAIIAVLAVGVAANSAVLSIVSGVLLDPLPYEDPKELALLRVDRPETANHPLVSGMEYYAFRNADWVTDAAAVTMQFDMPLSAADESLNVPIVGVTSNLFSMLGVQPILGAGFPQDGTMDARSVLLTWELWQNHFGGDPDLIGRSVIFGEASYRILGILPAGFRLLLSEDTGVTPDVGAFFPSRVAEGNPNFATFRVIARLSTDVDRANQGAVAVGRALASQSPEALADGRSYRLVALHSDLVSGVRSGLMVLLAEVGLLMLVACMNAAGLLLAWSGGEGRQLAVRAALGASPARLRVQIMAASGILTAIAAVVGVGLGTWLMNTGLSLYPESVPRVDELTLDGRALGMSIALAGAVALAFGVFPALQVGRTNPHSVLRSSSTLASRPSRTRYSLVVGQVALSVVLLVGAGLMVQTTTNLRGIPLGFEPSGLATAQVVAPRSDGGFWRFYEELATTLEDVQGVSSVSAVSRTPLMEVGDVEIMPYHAVGDETTGGLADVRWVMPGYFDTMGTRFLEGGGFSGNEVADMLPVVVIDEQVARNLWPGETALGRELMVPAVWGGDPTLARVVGVVEHARLTGLRGPGRAQVFRSVSLTPFGVMTVLVRSSLERNEVFRILHQAASDLGARNVVDEWTANEIVEAATARTRLIATLLVSLAFAAVLVSLVGLYGLLTFLAQRRTGEVGVRMALGARRWQVERRYVAEGLQLVAFGLAFGLGIAWVSGGLIASLLFGVEAGDPRTFVAMAALYVAVAALACYVPARRAALTDPAAVLRSDA